MCEEITRKDTVLMLFFLSACGNVFWDIIMPRIIYVILATGMLFYFIINYNIIKENLGTFYIKKIELYFLCVLVLFLSQYFEFGWNTFPGLINFISKIIVGIGVMLYFGEDFKWVYFKTMYFICAVSLPLWCLQIFDDGIGGMDWDMGKTIWIYCYRANNDIVRNCGFFWEPGALGGYINLLILFFINDIQILIKHHKKQCFVILLALLSTQSSGGYLGFMAIFSTFLIVRMESRIKYLLIPIVAFTSTFLYTSLSFLQEKVEIENAEAATQNGAFSSSRIGTLVFDLHYIKKHPLIGNGLHERTRYADHQAIAKALKSGELAGIGNGLSDIIAKWGFLFLVIYFYIFWTMNYDTHPKIKGAFIVLLLLILNGECFFNYPLFLGLPFLYIGDNSYEDILEDTTENLQS